MGCRGVEMLTSASLWKAGGGGEYISGIGRVEGYKQCLYAGDAIDHGESAVSTHGHARGGKGIGEHGRRGYYGGTKKIGDRRSAGCGGDGVPRAPRGVSVEVAVITRSGHSYAADFHHRHFLMDHGRIAAYRGIDHYAPHLPSRILSGRCNLATDLHEEIHATVAAEHLAYQVAAVAFRNCREIKLR